MKEQTKPFWRMSSAILQEQSLQTVAENALNPHNIVTHLNHVPPIVAIIPFWREIS